MSTNVAQTPIVNNTEAPIKAEQTPKSAQGETTPRDATPKAATPRAETEKTAAVENQTAQHATEEKKVLGLTELTNLSNRIDEILLRSSSATLVSQRNLSSSLDVSYLSGNKTVTVETVKTSANPLYTSQIHATSPTYSLAATHRSDIDLLRSIQNYQVKTVHGVESLTRSIPTQYHHVEEIRSATYPSYSFVNHQVGYDKQKLDQIISRIQGNTPRTHTLEVVKNHSAPLEYREYRVQTSETKKSSRPQKESFKHIEADEDSFIQEAKSAQQQRYEEQPESQSPTKKRSINKRQEILSAKKQNPNREIHSPSPNRAQAEERQARNVPPVEEQEEQSEQKNDLIMLNKKPSLRNSYYFGNEQRRGGSTLLQDGRHRE